MPVKMTFYANNNNTPALVPHFSLQRYVQKYVVNKTTFDGPCFSLICNQKDTATF